MGCMVPLASIFTQGKCKAGCFGVIYSAGCFMSTIELREYPLRTLQAGGQVFSVEAASR
jgi:hypothetical protein